MFALKCLLPLTRNSRCLIITQNRNVQISIIGASSDIGSNLAMLLKLNEKVTKLHMHDDDEKVRGVALELGYIPGGPAVAAFTGDNQLAAALRGSDLVLMVARVARKIGMSREAMLITNAPAIQRLCRTFAKHNPDAFLAISTNPINSILPFASCLLANYNCYNPFKTFGITHIDTARCRAFVGNELKVNSRVLEVPVIGGHSEDTIVPLFSNLYPETYRLDDNQADMLTRLARKAGTDVILNKQGTESATLAMAWSINEFTESIIDAIKGEEVTVNSYSANPNFGTRFFSGPVIVGAKGIREACSNFKLNDYENSLLQETLPILNRDIIHGERYVGVVECTGRYYT